MLFYLYYKERVKIMEPRMQTETAAAEKEAAAVKEETVLKNPYAAGGALPAPAPAPVKSKNTGWKALAVIMCLMILFSTTLSLLSLALQAANLFIGGGIDPEGILGMIDISRENDVKIAEEYTIRSTENISDAYLSGNTDGLTDREKETLDMAKKVLDQIVTEDMTDFEKEIAVYTWLTTKLRSDRSILTVIPETDENTDNPFGVLKYGDAVCVGYATTFRLFMQMLGINCMVVHDSYLNHTWDLVQLDGDWYHTDCYYDSPAGNFHHFNMTDAARAEDEEWNRDFFPAATGTKYNYAVYACETVQDIYAVPQWVKNGIEAGKTMLSCRFENGVEDEQAAMYMADCVCDAASYAEGSEDLYLENSWTENDDGELILCIYIEDYSDDPSVDLPDQTMEKIDNAVAEVFTEWSGIDEDDEIGWDEDGVFFEDTTEVRD